MKHACTSARIAAFEPVVCSAKDLVVSFVALIRNNVYVECDRRESLSVLEAMCLAIILNL